MRLTSSSTIIQTRIFDFSEAKLRFAGCYNDVSLTQRRAGGRDAAEMTFQRSWAAAGLEMTRLAHIQHFTANCYNMSRICQQTQGSFPYFIVKVTIWSDVVRPIGAQDWGSGPMGGENEAEPPQLSSSPAEANLITAFMELPLLHPAKIVSASSFRVTFHSHCRQIPHKTRSNKIFRYYPILLLEITC